MPFKALRVEPPSPGYWERTPPPVDQELWKRYLNEDDSDSDASDTVESEMAGPSSTSKSTKSEAPEGKPKSKNDLIKEVLDDAFNDQIYQILNGDSPEETHEASASADRATQGQKLHHQTSTDPKPTSDLEVCSNCSLPRLRHPRIGLNSRPPPDPNAQYCANEPPIVLAGHDVHGNAFPGFKPKNNTTTTTTTTTTAAGSKATKPKLTTTTKPSSSSTSKAPPASATTTTTSITTETVSVPSSPSSSQSSSTPSFSAPPPSSSTTTATTSAEYPQIRTPQMKCPNSACKQWKAVNVMAKHLDACLLGKGRKAGREARERIGNGAGNANGNGTPAEGSRSQSRAGTPRLGAGTGGGVGGVKRGREREREGASGEGEGGAVGAVGRGGGGGGGGGKKQKKGK